MSHPVGLFALVVRPGTTPEALDIPQNVVITNIAYGTDELKGNKRSVVKVHHVNLPDFTDSDDEDFDEEGEDEDDGDDDEDDEEVKEPKKFGKANADEEEEDEQLAAVDGIEDEIEEETYVLASLTPGKIEQVSVNITFNPEELVSISVTGDNEVHLLGNYILGPQDFDETPDSSEYGDSDLDDIASEDDEEIDSDEAGSISDDEELDDDEMMALLDDDDEEEDSDEDASGRIEEIDEEKTPSTSAKALSKKRAAEEADTTADSTSLSKNQRKRLNKKLKATDGEAAEASPAAAAAEEKKAAATATSKAAEAKAKATEEKTKAVAEAKAKKEKAAPEAKKAEVKKQKLSSGLIIEDRTAPGAASGPAARPGQRVGMRYIGRLQNGKIFDQNTKGKPFSFKLGKGEVIKGWDEGVKGMQVGSERRLICPPHLAYGSRGAGKDIKPNSTLIFDVRLVELK